MIISGWLVALIFAAVLLLGALAIAILERLNDKKMRENNADMMAAFRDRARAVQEKREEMEYDRHNYSGE